MATDDGDRRTSAGSPSEQPSQLSIEQLMMQLKPCKVVLQDCLKEEPEKGDDDAVSVAEEKGSRGRDSVHDDYEDSSESASLPARRTDPTALR